MIRKKDGTLFHEEIGLVAPLKILRQRLICYSGYRAEPKMNLNTTILPVQNYMGSPPPGVAFYCM